MKSDALVWMDSIFDKGVDEDSSQRFVFSSVCLSRVRAHTHSLVPLVGLFILHYIQTGAHESGKKDISNWLDVGV